MYQKTAQLSIETRGKSLIEFTATVGDFVADSAILEGLLTIFCRHTSASLLIQENADPDVRTDLKHFFERIAPEDGNYVHGTEGPDDMPAHIRSALTQTHLSIPILDRRLALGTWQGIYLFEHRAHAHRRTIVLHAIGEG